MPLNTLHDRLMADALLPATVRSALGLPAGSVYDGRRQKTPDQHRSVLVLPLESVLRVPGGDQLWEHRYELRLRWRQVRESAATGAQQLLLAKDGQRAVINAVNGARPWATTLTDLVTVRAEEGPLDDDPDEQGSIEAVVRLSVFTRGTGDVVVP